jgi:hypothetical protein
LAAAVESVDPGAARSIRALAAEKTIPRIEERLIELEHELIVRLLESDASGELRAEAMRAIGDPSRLDEKTRDRTVEANLRRVVRDRFALPRLTLFR